MTYHYVRLREAGLTRTRIAGAQRLITLRIDDIETRFPGLLPAVLAGARAERQLKALTIEGDVFAWMAAAPKPPPSDDGA